MFLLRLCCLPDVCFEISCLHRIILFVVVLLLMTLICVLVDAGLRKLLHIYFYIVIFLGLFGMLFIGGWPFRRSLRLLFWTILISSLQVVLALRRDNRLYRLFGLQLRGKFVKKEITDYSKANNAQFCRWLIRLRH